MNLMSRAIRWAAAALAVALALPVHAAPLVFQGSGAVTRIVPFAGSTATGSIGIGDALAFRLVFDPAASGSLFDGGDSFQVFAQPLSEVSVTIGSFTFGLGSPNPPVVLMGQGFRLFPGQFGTEPAFTQQFVLPGLPAANPPFTATVGGGTTFSLESAFRIPAFGPAPTIADLRAPNADPGLNRFNLSVFGAAPGYGGFVEGTFTGTLTPLAAVPEPASWALLIAGFGVVGAGMRRTPRPRRLALA